MQDLYAGSLARTSFTLVMLAIAGGDGAGCSASSGSTASSRTSSRRGLGKSAFGRRSAPSRGSSRGCSCCTGSRSAAVGAVVGPRRGRGIGAFDVVAVVRHRPDGPRRLCRRARRYPRGRGARELPARASRGDDRSDGDAQGGVARNAGRASRTAFGAAR